MAMKRDAVIYEAVLKRSLSTSLMQMVRKYSQLLWLLSISLVEGFYIRSPLVRHTHIGSK